MILFLLFINLLKHVKSELEPGLGGQLRCRIGPLPLHYSTCAFRTPYGAVYNIDDVNSVYENGTIECLCQVFKQLLFKAKLFSFHP